MSDFLPPVIAVLLADVKQFRAGMAEARGEMATTEAGASKLGAIGKVALLAVAAAAAAVAVHSVKMASAFDAAMERVHTQAGASQGQVDRLKNSVLDLAPKVGQGPDALALGLYHLESAGFRGAQAMSLLTAAAKGATIGNADLESVTQAMIASVASGIPGVHGAADAMALLNQTVGIGDMKMEGLAKAMATGILPSAKSAGLAFNDVAAALATITDNASPPDEAATRLRMTFAMLSAPTQAAAKHLKTIGLSSTALATDMRQPDGLLVALQDLKKHLEASGLSAVKQNAVIVRSFGGGRSSAALLTLLGEMDRLKLKYSELGSAGERQKQFQEAWAKTQEQFATKVAKLRAAFDVLMIRVGNALIPVITRFAQVLVTTGGFVMQHKVILAALASVIGTLLVAGLIYATVLMYEFAVAMLTAEVAGAPIWLIALAVIAVGVAIYELFTHWKTVWAFIKSIALDVAHAFVTAWNFVVSETERIWGDITSAVSTAWHAIAAFFVAAWHMVTDPIVNAWHAVASVTTTVWNAIAGFFRKWWPLLLVIFAAPIAVLLALWNHFHRQAEAVVRAVWDAITAFLRRVWTVLKTLAGDLWHGLYLAVVHPIEQVLAFQIAVWQRIFNVLAAAWQMIKSAAADAWNWVYDHVVGPVVRMLAKLTELFGQIVGAVTRALSAAVRALANIGSMFLGVGKAIVEGIVHGIAGAAGDIGSALKNAAGGALKDAKHFLGINSPSLVFSREVGQPISEGIGHGVGKGAHYAVDAIRALIRRLLSQENGLHAEMPVLREYQHYLDMSLPNRAKFRKDHPGAYKAMEAQAPKARADVIAALHNLLVLNSDIRKRLSGESHAEKSMHLTVGAASQGERFARAMLLHAQILARLTKGTSEHSVALTKLRYAHEDMTKAIKLENLAVRDRLILQNRKLAAERLAHAHEARSLAQAPLNIGRFSSLASLETHAEIHTHVSVDGKALFTAVQPHILRHGYRNLDNGVTTR